VFDAAHTCAPPHTTQPPEPRSAGLRAPEAPLAGAPSPSPEARPSELGQTEAQRMTLPSTTWTTQDLVRQLLDPANRMLLRHEVSGDRSTSIDVCSFSGPRIPRPYPSRTRMSIHRGVGITSAINRCTIPGALSLSTPC